MNEPHGGTLEWPADPDDLANAHKCPACFATVTSRICSGCGLNLGDERAPRVLRIGRKMVEFEHERRALLGEIRKATRMADAEAAARASAAKAVALTAVLREPPPPRPAPVPVDPSEIAAPRPGAVPLRLAPPSPAPAPEPRPARRRLSVPVLLLIVGVSLVGIAAIFFLLVAWFVWGIAVRAIIVGAITLAAIVAASWLRRRSLTATAEGLGALGIILLALDAWALRANDFFGMASSRPAVYAGAAMLAVAVIARVWSRVSGLRGPDLAAAVAFPAGIGLLLGGLLPLPTVEAIIVGFLGAAAGGLAFALPAPWSAARAGSDGALERSVLGVAGVASLAVAAGLTAFAADRPGAIALASVAVFVLGSAHAILLQASRTPDGIPAVAPMAAAASIIGVVTLGTAGWQLALHAGPAIDQLAIAPVVAVGVAVAADLVQTRMRTARPAAIAAAIVGGLSVVAAGLLWWGAAFWAMSTGWIAWGTDPFTAPPTTTQQPVLAIAAAAVIAGLLFAAPSLARPVARDARVVVGTVLILGAAAQSGIVAVAVGVDLVVMIATIVVLTRARAVAGWMAAGAVAGAAAFLQATATPWLWAIAVAAVIALPIAWRLILRPSGAKAVVLAVAPVAVATIAAIMAPAPLGVIAGAMGAAPVAAASLVQWVAVAALGAALFLPLERASRTAVAGTAEALIAATLVTVVAAEAGLISSGSAAEAVTAMVGGPMAALVRGLLILAVVAMVVVRGARFDRPVATAGAMLVAPVVAAIVHSILAVAGADAAPWAPIVLLASAVSVVGMGLWAGRSPAIVAAVPRVRVAAEAGAAAVASIVVWPTNPQDAWAVWALVAAGFAVASVSRGWTDVATTADDDVFATRAPGRSITEAPRRLLVWPAALATAVAWWTWLWSTSLDASIPAAAGAIPVGVGLAVLAAVLVRLRRRVEASVAIGAAVGVGLGWPAVAGWSADAWQGTVVALAAAALCLALSLTPLRRIRPTSPVGALAAVCVVGIVAVQRAVQGEPSDGVWLALLVALAFASGYGYARTMPERLSTTAYAQAVPPLVLVVAVASVLPWRSDAVAVTAALAALTTLHVVASAVGRAPLGIVTRWTSFGAAATIGVAGFIGGGIAQIESATLPLAGSLLVGAALATVRRRQAGIVWPGSETGVWIAGLVVASVPSLFAPVDPARLWTVIGASLAGAIAIGMAPIPAAWRVRTPSVMILAGTALVMAARGLAVPTLPGSAAAALAAGLGAIAVAVVLVSTAPAKARSGGAVALAAAASLLLFAVTVLQADGSVPSTTVIAVVGGVVGLQAAALLGSRRWGGLSAVIAVTGLLLATTACGIRFLMIAQQHQPEADFWVLIGAGIAVAIVVGAVRAAGSRAVGWVAGGVLGGTVLLVSAAELLLISLSDEGAQLRTALTMTGLAAATVVGTVWRRRIGLTLAIAAACAALLFGVAATLGFGVRPVELVTLPAAVAGIAYGSVRIARVPSARSWPSLGPWIGLLLVPSLLFDFSRSPELWRIVGLGVVALALVVAGAVWRLQAPLVLGSIVLLAHGAAQLWPWISSAYVAVPWWLWLGIGGAVLIFVAATYERRIRQLRSAYLAVASLR